MSSFHLRLLNTTSGQWERAADTCTDVYQGFYAESFDYARCRYIVNLCHLTEFQ
jgi:hypothetical protein